MGDGTGLAEALLGLDGFRVLEVSETPGEVTVRVETTASFAGCAACGTRAVPHERMVVAVRDLACFGRPARLVWVKRRWRCPAPVCPVKSWTERSDAVDAQVVLNRRAGAEACRQVGAHARPVAGPAGPARPASEPALPTQTRRAGKRRKFDIRVVFPVPVWATTGTNKPLPWESTK